MVAYEFTVIVEYLLVGLLWFAHGLNVLACGSSKDHPRLTHEVFVLSHIHGYAMDGSPGGETADPSSPTNHRRVVHRR